MKFVRHIYAEGAGRPAERDAIARARHPRQRKRSALEPRPIDDDAEVVVYERGRPDVTVDDRDEATVVELRRHDRVRQRRWCSPRARSATEDRRGYPESH